MMDHSRLAGVAQKTRVLQNITIVLILPVVVDVVNLSRDRLMILHS
jgi:hypothetical protein